MKKSLVLFFAFVLWVMPVFAGTASTGTDMFSYIPYSSASWDSQSTTESGGETTVLSQSIMFKGKKMRMESVITDKSSGNKVHQAMIMTNKVMYIINEDEKSGSKFSMDSAANPEKYRAKAAKYRNTAKKTGSETINGIPCGIYKYTYDYDGQESGEKMNVTEWRSKDGFVIKNISEWKGSKITNLVSNIKKNPALSDSLFEPAADIKIIDMDNMMKGMFSAPAEEKNTSVKSSKPMPMETESDTGLVEDKSADPENAPGDDASTKANNVLKGILGQ
jgi:outer membrane lipoprotein-sorting protein